MARADVRDAFGAELHPGAKESTLEPMHDPRRRPSARSRASPQRARRSLAPHAGPRSAESRERRSHDLSGARRRHLCLVACALPHRSRDAPLRDRAEARREDVRRLGRQRGLDLGDGDGPARLDVARCERHQLAAMGGPNTHDQSWRLSEKDGATVLRFSDLEPRQARPERGRCAARKLAPALGSVAVLRELAARLPRK